MKPATSLATSPQGTSPETSKPVPNSSTFLPTIACSRFWREGCGRA